MATTQWYLDSRAELDAGRLGRADVLDLLTAEYDLAASVVHHAERADRAEAEIERLRAELRGDQAHVAAAARARERDEALAEVDRLRIERDRYIREAESLRAAASSASDTAHANTSGAI